MPVYVRVYVHVYVRVYMHTHVHVCSVHLHIVHSIYNICMATCRKVGSPGFHEARFPWKYF